MKNNEKLIVNEIFNSIEGEGIRTGFLVTFIRLQGCNLSCSYCDSRYSCVGDEGKEMSINGILKAVSLYTTKKITLTGGEPLIHQNVMYLINTLIYNGYEVNIETNGSVDILPFVIDNTIITMDYKSKMSGMQSCMNLSNFSKLRKLDVLKFVVGSNQDLYDMQTIVELYKPVCNIFVSPVFGQIELIDIFDYIKENDLNDIRMQIQMHKIIWEPTSRGV